MTDDEIDGAVARAGNKRIPCIVFPSEALYRRYLANRPASPCADYKEANAKVREVAARIQQRGGRTRSVKRS